MKCPACGNELTQIAVGSIAVDSCKDGCGGIWFDKFELNKVDEAHETLGESLLDIPRGEGVRVNRGKRRCPRCNDIVMMRHFFTVKQEVEVDECPKCGGFWLDTGELAAIRKQFATEAERKQAAQAFITQTFGAQMEEMRQKSQEKKERARKIARILRFLCPSYYIPGDQDWGAF